MSTKYAQLIGVALATSVLLSALPVQAAYIHSFKVTGTGPDGPWQVDNDPPTPAFDCNSNPGPSYQFGTSASACFYGGNGGSVDVSIEPDGDDSIITFTQTEPYLITSITLDLYDTDTMMDIPLTIVDYDQLKWLGDFSNPYAPTFTSLGANAQNNFDFTVGNPVPEPASWAMLIAGFGLTGAAMRRRRIVALAA